MNGRYHNSNTLKRIHNPGMVAQNDGWHCSCKMGHNGHWADARIHELWDDLEDISRECKAMLAVHTLQTRCIEYDAWVVIDGEASPRAMQ